MFALLNFASFFGDGSWSLFRQRRTGNGRQNSNGACGLLLQVDGAGFPSVRFSRAHGAGFPGVRGVRRWISQREILEGTLHKFDFDPKLQKNWVTGETWELKARSCRIFRVPRLWLLVRFNRHHIGLLRHTRQTQHACMLDMSFSHLHGPSFLIVLIRRRAKKRKVLMFT